MIAIVTVHKHFTLDADEMLEYLNTERDICETRMMLLETDFLNDCADREIVEYWDESQIEEWRSNCFFLFYSYFYIHI